MSIGALIGIYGLYNYTVRVPNVKIKPKQSNDDNIICYSNCESNNYSDNYSEYDDSSDSDTSEDFNVRSYALTEYEYY